MLERRPAQGHCPRPHDYKEGALRLDISSLNNVLSVAALDGVSAVGELKGESAANYDSSFSQPPPDEGRDLFLCAAWQETTSVASLLCGG